MNVGAKFWPALHAERYLRESGAHRLGGAGASADRESRVAVHQRKSATVLHPASMAPMARPMSASVDEPPPSVLAEVGAVSPGQFAAGSRRPTSSASKPSLPGPASAIAF
jgi:hypothetical protein